MGDDPVRLGPRPWSPPLPIVWRGVEGAVVEQRGLQASHKPGERLLGTRCPGKRGPAQRFESSDFLVTLLAPLLVDGALSLRLTMVRVNEAPAWRAPAITR